MSFTVSDALQQPTRSPRLWLPVLLWTLFISALALQVLSPHLKIEHNAFAIPQSLLAAHPGTAPSAIIARQRLTQTLSAALVLLTALGLAFHYRRLLAENLGFTKYQNN